MRRENRQTGASSFLFSLGSSLYLKFPRIAKPFAGARVQCRGNGVFKTGTAPNSNLVRNIPIAAALPFARATGSARPAGRRAMVFAALLFFCGLLCDFAAARNVALLVAVGQLQDPQMKSQQLLGTSADIDSMQQALVQHWGFQPGDVRSLRDAEATHERILAEISALEQRSARGDIVLIYFSGHGTSANADDNSFDLPYATGAWVPYDLDLSTLATAGRSLIIGRRDLVPRLKRLDEGGRRVVVVSDSCYSGQVVRAFGQTHSHTRYLPLVTRDLGVSRQNSLPGSLPSARPPPPPYPYQHVVLLSGASDSETGADISSQQALQLAPTLDGKFHGAFTDAFLRLLDGKLLPGAFSYAQAREALNSFLEHRNFAQHPQLLPALAEDPQDVGANPFLGMTTSTQPSQPSQSGQSGAHGPLGSPVQESAATATARDATVHVQLDAVSAVLRSRIAALSGVAIVTANADLILRQQGGKALLLGPAGDPVVSTTVDDPNLIKRIAAQVWLNRSLPVGTDTLGLRAETNPGSRGNTYVQCEAFAFEVKLARPAYVMLLDLDSEGNLTVLYPTRAEERQAVAPGTAKAIPGAEPKDRILVTAPFGSDQVAVLAFERLPGAFAEMNDAQRFSADSVRALSLARGLAGTSGAVSVQQIVVHTYPGSGGRFCGS